MPSGRGTALCGHPSTPCGRCIATDTRLLLCAGRSCTMATRAFMSGSWEPGAHPTHEHLVEDQPDPSWFAVGALSRMLSPAAGAIITPHGDDAFFRGVVADPVLGSTSPWIAIPSVPRPSPQPLHRPRASVAVRRGSGLRPAVPPTWSIGSVAVACGFNSLATLVAPRSAAPFRRSRVTRPIATARAAGSVNRRQMTRTAALDMRALLEG